MIHDVLRPNFSEIVEQGYRNFDYWPKLVLLKVSDGYIKTSKIQTTRGNRLKYGLKCSQGSTLLIHDVLRPNFSKNCGMGVPKFWLSAKNGAPKVEDGYIKASKIQTTFPKRLKYGLKWSPGLTLHDCLFVITGFNVYVNTFRWLSMTRCQYDTSYKVWRTLINSIITNTAGSHF